MIRDSLIEQAENAENRESIEVLLFMLLATRMYHIQRLHFIDETSPKAWINHNERFGAALSSDDVLKHSSFVLPE